MKTMTKMALFCGSSILTATACNTTPPPCPAGYYMHAERCVNPRDSVEKYAGCVVHDARIRTSKSASTKLDSAKTGATSASEVKDRFERTVESTNDRCLLLDISSRCFRLASGEKDTPSLPAECMHATIDE